MGGDHLTSSAFGNSNRRFNGLRIGNTSRFSEKVLLVLSGKSDVRADAKKIGPALICERLLITTHF
jgi:hypothetical protein